MRKKPSAKNMRIARDVVAQLVAREMSSGELLQSIADSHKISEESAKNALDHLMWIILNPRISTACMPE